MAYAAVISLKQTIHRLLNSSQISIVSSSREILDCAYNEVMSLQLVLKRLDDSRSRSSKRLNALDGQIREAVRTLENLLEFHESNDQFLSGSENYGDEGFPYILTIEINSFAETVKEMKEEYIKELDNTLPEDREEEEEDDDDAAVSSASSSVAFGVKMVGLSDEFREIKKQVLKGVRPSDFGVFSIVSGGDFGRTIVANNIFEEIYIGKEQPFDCGPWATIGPNYQFKEILLGIVAQIDPGIDEMLRSEGDEEIAIYLHTTLMGRRYMIVLDDVCDTHVWDFLRSSFPEQHNGSLVLLTTGLMEVAISADSLYTYEMAALSVYNSWINFFRPIMSCQGLMSPEHDEAAMKIAENCQGSRLAVIKVLLLLMTAENSPELWNNLAADKENSVFKVADEMSELRKIKENLQLRDCDDAQRDLNAGLWQMFTLPLLTAKMKMQMFPKRFLHKMESMSFFGMAGIGKTNLVKEIFEEQSIFHHFDHRVWITLGPKYQSKEILVDILAQIYPNIDKMHIKGEAKLARDLCAQLSDKRCLIVLDDVWNKEPLHYFKMLLPDIKGKALVTTRLVEVAKSQEFDKVQEIRLLNKEESWCLFRQKVFAEEFCPLELEKAGKMISKNCEGLPLLILTVADILSKFEKTLVYWNKVAEKQNSVFMDAKNQILKILLPSYKYLPQHLKACFLYMGVFSQNYKISISKLINLWIAEGFLETNPSQTIEDFATECFLELVDRSLVIVQKGSNFAIKTCRLHSVFWHLSNNEAAKNKFFYALNSYANKSIQGLESKRRLCIRNSSLLGIKDGHIFVASIPIAHSLLCTGPPHQFPVPLYFGLRLLRVLDTLIIRFYEFPIEVVELIHLRYLALTCTGKLPATISKLWKLQFLIVSQHLSIKSLGDSMYLPVELWDMKELKHLQVKGSNLPIPSDGAVLPNLLTLLDVGAQSCTVEVLIRIPNLRRLGIQIELLLDDDGKHFHYLNHISLLSRLESLKCVVVNPELRLGVVAPPAPCSMFPSSLKKLILSGFGYPWKYMSIIGQLKNLEVLELRCHAFRGPE